MTNTREHDLGEGQDLLDLDDELSWDPIRLAPPDPWVGHIPFAFWLIKALRPKNLVELGTHSGNSYFAFCQALARFSPGARAYAVDTWQGDAHAGHYSDEIFQDVHLFNRTHFAQFSTLMRMTFDDARAYFPDGEIDLLHIDGLHSYDAVKHDFDNWKSALSPRGVVLFHDTNVRERDFGVWRLWKELSESYPSFEFGHSNGLGVLGVGADQAPLLRRLFEISGKTEATANLRKRVATRGETFQQRVENQTLRSELNGLRAQIDTARGHIDELTKALANERSIFATRFVELDGQRSAEISWRDTLIGERSSLIAAKDELIRIFENLAAARSATIAARDAILQSRDHQIMRLMSDVRAQSDHYEAKIAALTEEVSARARVSPDQQPGVDAMLAQAAQSVALLQAQLNATVQAYVTSTSWKITRPLRVAMRLARTGRLRAPRDAIAPAPQQALMPPPPVADMPPAAQEPAPTVDDVTAETGLKSAMRTMLMARLEAFLSGSEMLRLPRSDRPEISILLVLYNQAELTFGCLSSILETLGSGGPAVEVIIVDNASTDMTTALLDRIEGATVIRNPSNLHFLKAVNLGAKSVQGRAILLLNNDAQLLPGSVASALHTLDSAPDIGAVGGRIILPDGTLQEAGSIIWQDGACSGYGRGQDPSNPDFMYQRDVDYCSGAFLLTPTSVFRELGGFDERFAPAYYEETDYCVRLWESGRRVVFDPDVTIIHFEFGSSSGSSEALALQQTNYRIFASQHAEWLAGQFEASPANVLAARTARSRQPRILVIEDRVPKIELGTGYPRSNRLLHELLDAGAQVTLFPIHRHAETWQGVRRALDKRIEVLIRAEGSQIRGYLDARRGHFDAIIVCRPPNMDLVLEAIGAERDLIGQAKVIYDAEALFVSRILQKMEAEGQPATETERHRLIAQEVTLTRLADAVVSVSPAEQTTLEDYGAKQVYLLGHALDDKPLATGFEERDQIVFLGAMQEDDAPNADAVRWFASEILPDIRRSLGQDLRLTVIGRAGAPTIKALDGTDVDLVGMVEDLVPALARARILVVPTRFAAGIPHKVHQAAMLGIPMVVTDLIFDQLGWNRDEDVLVASEPKAFAAACVRLYTDRSMWEATRANALAHARQDCAPEIFTATVRRIVNDIPLTRKRPEPTREDRKAMEQERRDAKPGEPHTSRPAESDFSVAVPFDYQPRAVSPRIAVICHIFYPALAQEMLYYCRHLPASADLLITTDTDEKRRTIAEVFAAWAGGAVEVRVTPNRGRDIAPKLIAYADRYDKYELVLHLHSKVSDHAAFLTTWRSFLFENLAGSPAVVASILDAFDRLPDLGMVASQHYESIRRWIGWNNNYAQAQALAKRMGIALSPTRALDFPSGSMFWVRPAALKPLLDLQLSFEDFPEEGAQVDETPAHAIERLYFYVCERAGFSWLKVAQPALFMDSSRILTMSNPEALSRFVGERSVMLSGPADIAVRAEPAPMMTRAPPGLARRLIQRKL